MDFDEDSSSQTHSAPNLPSAGSTPQGVSNSASGSQGNSASGSGPSSAQLSKRRRGLGVVTPNACTECRKKRAKCDGQRPCGRCKAQKDVECVYEMPVRQSKDNLRSEIDNLRRHQRTSNQVFAALIRPELWEEVIMRLRNGQTIDRISEWLGGTLPSSGHGLPAFPHQASTGMPPLSGFAPAGPSNADPMGSPSSAQQSNLRNEMGQSSQWQFSGPGQMSSVRSGSQSDAISWAPDVHGAPPQSRVGFWAESQAVDPTAEGLPRFRGLEQVLSPLSEPDIRSPTISWTTITADINLVQHLLALYFCWEYPTFASLSKEHFLRDFQDGRQRYCSSILVNALLALGCRFSTQPMTRANPSDPYSSGDHFFKESLRLFHDEMDHHSLTTIQALGIMSIREASCGRDSESWYYAGQSIRLAIEMGLHHNLEIEDEDEVAVRSATFWGAFALDHAWSLATGSLPQCSHFPHLPPKPAIIDDIESSLWVPYTDDGAPLQRSCEQPSNVRSVYKCFCESSELVHQSLYLLHTPGRPLVARDLLSIYTQYLNWYDRIPEVLRLGHNFTPAVLFAHMYYHFAILLLFRPLIKLRIIGSNVAPRDVCSQAAIAIQGLLRSYSQLYTLRRTPSFVPYFVLTATIMQLAIGAASAQKEGDTLTPEVMEMVAKRDQEVTNSISQGIADLAEMAPCHQFAEQALNILRYLAKKWNIDVNFDSSKPPPEDFDKLVRPYTGSMNFFTPNVQSEDLVCDWGAAKPKMSQAKLGTRKTADSMENLLFWPFPMQGRPMLPSGPALEQAGFAII